MHMHNLSFRNSYITCYKPVHRRRGAPESAQSRSDPARKGTAESQASTMHPNPLLASFPHKACQCIYQILFQHPV